MAVIFMLLGNFMSATSLVLMKVGHKKVINNGGNYYGQFYWILGCCLMLVREFLHVAALGYGN